MKKINLLLIAALSLVSIEASAQSSLPFDEQYFIMDNFLINPSFAGSSEDVVLKAAHRRQWDNMPNGPITNLVTAHANIVDRVGFGLYLMNDNNGNTRTNGFNLSGAYHIPIGDKKDEGRFSFGTSLSFANMTFRGETQNPNDPIYNDMETRIFIPYINFGASATYKGWLIGVSALDIPLSYNSPIVNQLEPSPTFYYGMLGKTIAVTEQFELEPMLVYRSNFDKDSRFDANLRGNLKFEDNIIWAGANYRMDFFDGNNQSLSVSPMLGAQFGRTNIALAYNIQMGDVAIGGNNGFTAVLGFDIENFFKPSAE